MDVSAATIPGVFAAHPNLFSDRSHLNAQGARQYSELLADALDTRLAAGPVRWVPAPIDQFLGQQSGGRSWLSGAAGGSRAPAGRMDLTA